MEFVLGLAVGAMSAVVGLNILLFGGIAVIFVLGMLWSISGDERSIGWATFWGILLVAGLGVRFWPELTVENVSIGLAVWILGGLVYAYFRLKSQSHRLRTFVDEMVTSALKSTNGAYPITVRPEGDSDRTLRRHRVYIHVKWSGSSKEFSNESEVLAWYAPKFADNRGLALSWASFWVVLFLQDITIDAIENLQDWLKNVYQSGMSDSFGAKPSA